LKDAAEMKKNSHLQKRKVRERPRNFIKGFEKNDNRIQKKGCTGEILSGH
jgi:hypothetical protein